MTQQDDRVTTTTTTTATVAQAHVTSTAAWSPEEGELEDVEEDTLKVTVGSDEESSIKSANKISLVGESVSSSEVKETDQTRLVCVQSNIANYYCFCICSSEEGSSGRKLVGSSSGTPQSTTATTKGSANTEQSGKSPTSNYIVY